MSPAGIPATAPPYGAIVHAEGLTKTHNGDRAPVHAVRAWT
ncbi:hypothetical protein ACFWVU_00135 [Streptomyces sp. NPDC058686]